LSIVIYGRHTSYNVQKVLWLLDELGLSYQHIELGGKPGDTETEEFGLLNPMRKVPVLVDNEHVVWESNTILRYLTNTYGSGPWKVEDACQRSLFERWMDWSQTIFEPAFVGVFWGYYRTPAKLHDREAIQKSIKECLDCLAKLDDQLGGRKYLVGEYLSLADISTGIFMYRLVEMDLNINLPENVDNWYKRLRRSSAYQQWVMSDFSSLKGRLEY
jgi:glutathione S-transferase